MNRRVFKRRLQYYSDLVIAPRMAQHTSLAQLNSIRLHMLTGVLELIAGMPAEERQELYWRIERMAHMAPNNAPCPIGGINAWELAKAMGVSQ